MTLLDYLVPFALALGLLILVHELGHYLVARWCGVKILRFSIGFGKPLATWTVGPDRTEWALSAIPLGGYVKMVDERDTSAGPISPEDLPRAFTQQSLGKRALIVVAGPVANFLLAIALYFVLNSVGVQEPAAIVAAPAQSTAAATAGLAAGDRVLAVDGRDVRSWNEVRLRMIDGVIERRAITFEVERGDARTVLSIDTSGLPAGEVERDFQRSLGLDLAAGRVVIASVLPEGAAARAGLRAEDQVVGLDGAPVSRSTALIEAIRANPQRPLRLDVQRGADQLRIEIVPDARASERPDEAGRMVGRINAGIANRVQMVEVRFGPFESLQRAAGQTWDMSLFSLRMLGKMLVGELSWRNLSGPVSIADYAGQSARIGWYAYLSFMALISISLGVLNLLPIPVLDGGHLVYYGLEALRGRPLSERFVEITQKAGLAMIAAMMIMALFNDFTRLIGS